MSATSWAGVPAHGGRVKHIQGVHMPLAADTVGRLIAAFTELHTVRLQRATQEQASELIEEHRTLIGPLLRLLRKLEPDTAPVADTKQEPNR
jgi:hypothetical protein